MNNSRVFCNVINMDCHFIKRGSLVSPCGHVLFIKQIGVNYWKTSRKNVTCVTCYFYMWMPTLWLQSNSYANEMVRCSLYVSFLFDRLRVINFNLGKNNISLDHCSHSRDIFNTRRDVSYVNAPCYIMYFKFEKYANKTSENKIKRLKMYPTVGSSLDYLLGRRGGWRGGCRKGWRGWTVVSPCRSSSTLLSCLNLSLSSCLLLSLSLLRLSLSSSLGSSSLSLLQYGATPWYHGFQPSERQNPNNSTYIQYFLPTK